MTWVVYSYLSGNFTKYKLRRSNTVAPLKNNLLDVVEIFPTTDLWDHVTLIRAGFELYTGARVGLMFCCVLLFIPLVILGQTEGYGSDVCCQVSNILYVPPLDCAYYDQRHHQ